MHLCLFVDVCWILCFHVEAFMADVRHRFVQEQRRCHAVGAARTQKNGTNDRRDRAEPVETDPGQCVGCDIVQADHAPEAGVAQGIFHGVLVRHHGRIQEEVEEGLENKVERETGEEENTQATKHKCACMDDME